MEESKLTEATLTLQKAAAELLSQIRDFCRTSQRTTDSLVKGIDSILDLYLDCLLEKFKQDLSYKSGYIKIQEIESLVSSLKEQSIFTGVQTRKQLESYLQEKSGGKKVLLQQLILEEKVVLRRGIPVKVPSEYGYSVPFLPQLEQVLNCKDIMECVDNPLPQQDQEMCTVTHGLFYKYHPLVKLHGKRTLAITFHVDDAEVDDPLKSKAGRNNLRLFYWVLANIHPEKRSGLKAINLIAIVKAKTAKKFGNAHFLQDFIEGLIKLATEGVEFNIDGKVERFWAVLLFGSADNPAACNIGGFKETFSALKPCRLCNIKSSDLLKLFVEDPALLRKLTEHNAQVAEVTGYYNKSQVKKTKQKKQGLVIVNVYEGDENISAENVLEDTESDFVEEQYLDHSNPSVRYGVNSRSPLCDVPYFDVTKCLVLDILHLLFEGVVDLVCRLLLKDLCFPYQHLSKEERKGKEKPPLTLDFVNHVITNLADFGHLNVSRPTPLDKKHVLGKKLKQSGSQMSILVYIMPFIVNKVCPEEKVELLLKLIKLVNLCMSYKVQADNRLQEAVRDFLTNFTQLYPGVKTLKLHGLVHLPTQMKLFGPLRQQWCFNFESMHSEFTGFANVIKSRKNIALSAASRHLDKRNAQIMQGKETGDYLCTRMQLKDARAVAVGTLHIKDSLLRKLPDLNEDSSIVQVAEVTKDGNTWKEGVNILVKKEDDSCTFGRISKIFIVSDQPVFVFNILETQFIRDFSAYEIARSKAQSDIIKLCDIPHPFPVARFSFQFPKGNKSYLLLMSDIKT